MAKDKRKHLDIILKEMFKRVGAEDEYTEEYVQGKDWYMNYEWTMEEQDEFKEWFIKYLKDSKEARGDLYDRSLWNERAYEKAASYFLMNYGWKFKS